MEEIKSNNYVYSQIPKKEEFEKNYAKRKAVLDSVTPPTATDLEKKTISARAEALASAMVHGDPQYVPPMPEEDQMQRPRAGSVDQHMRWESFWKKHTLAEDNKTIERVDPKKGGRGAVWEWKDLRRIVYKDVEEEMPNAANVEMIRPAGGQTPLHETHLPVSYGFSPIVKKHYDEVFPDHVKTDVEKKLEADTVKLDTLVKQVTAPPKRKRFTGTAQREASRARMKAYWAKRKAAEVA
jgi:hypothetical protein